MRKLWVLTIALLLTAVYADSWIDNPARLSPPRISALEPDGGRPGDVITAHGHSLDRSRVEDLSLTAQERYLLVHILDQEETLIRFRIPASATPGRWTIVIHPVGKYSSGLQQPVTLTVR